MGTRTCGPVKLRQREGETHGASELNRAGDISSAPEPDEQDGAANFGRACSCVYGFEKSDGTNFEKSDGTNIGRYGLRTCRRNLFAMSLFQPLEKHYNL